MFQLTSSCRWIQVWNPRNSSTAKNSSTTPASRHQATPDAGFIHWIAKASAAGRRQEQGDHDRREAVAHGRVRVLELERDQRVERVAVHEVEHRERRDHGGQHEEEVPGLEPARKLNGQVTHIRRGIESADGVLRAL